MIDAVSPLQAAINDNSIERDRLAADVESFLAAGGQIEVVTAAARAPHCGEQHKPRTPQ